MENFEGDSSSTSSRIKLWNRLRIISLVFLSFILLLILCVVFAAVGIYWSWQSKMKYAPNCSENQYICRGNNYCLDVSRLCNSVVDCITEGEDESFKFGCDNSVCYKDEIECADGNCLKRNLMRYQDNSYSLCSEGNQEQFSSVILAQTECHDRLRYFPCGKTSDGCIYRKFLCDGKNHCPNGTDEVGCSKPTVVKPPVQKVYAYEEDTISISCIASGKPIPVIKWHFNFGHSSLPRKCNTSSINGVGILKCPVVEENDNGKFACQAVNRLGSVFAVPFCELVVQRLPLQV